MQCRQCNLIIFLGMGYGSILISGVPKLGPYLGRRGGRERNHPAARKRGSKENIPSGLMMSATTHMLASLVPKPISLLFPTSL